MLNSALKPRSHQPRQPQTSHLILSYLLSYFNYFCNFILFIHILLKYDLGLVLYLHMLCKSLNQL